MAWYDYIPGGKMVHSFMNPDEGYEAARKEMEEKWRQAQGWERPYWQAGLDQRDRLTGAEDRLLDPSKLLAEWMEKYQTSPYAKKSMENAKNSGLDTASSMGLMGSSTALNNIQNASGDIMNKDRQGFLNDMMRKYMAGVGIGQNMYDTGAGMAANMGNQAVRVGEDTGAAKYGEKNAPGDQMMRMLAMLAASMGGGGGMGGARAAGASGSYGGGAF